MQFKQDFLNFCVVNNKEIHISSDHTSYFNLLLREELEPRYVIKKRKELIAIAKSKGIQVKYKNNTLSKIKELKPHYESAYIAYYFSFQKLVNTIQSLLNKKDFFDFSEKEKSHLLELRNDIEKKLMSHMEVKKLSDILDSIEYNFALIKEDEADLFGDKINFINI